MLSLLPSALLAGCGDEGPTRPSSTSTAGSPAALANAPASTTATLLTVVSGETGEPVAGATLIVAGRTYETDEAGQVNVLERPSASTLLDILAPNFLDRQTIWRSAAETQFTLWPRTSPTGLNEEFTRRIVYTYGFPDAIPGAAPLLRLPADAASVDVVISGEIDADIRARRAVDEAVAAMSAALGGQITYQVSAGGASARPTIEVVVDPEAVSSDFSGILRRRLQGFTIISCHCAFRSTTGMRDARLIASSFGFCFGLNRSPDSTDRMFPEWWSRSRSDFSQKESLVMSLMLQRRAGNRFPDNDREARSTALGETVYLRAKPPT